MMLHTKYQGFRPCGFRQEDFFMFSLYSLCKTCDLHFGPFFGPWGIYDLNKLGRGPLDDAAYQVSGL